MMRRKLKTFLPSTEEVTIFLIFEHFGLFCNNHGLDLDLV